MHYIEKKYSQMLYGVAILIMIFHHMFGFPERIQVEYIGLFSYKLVPVETILAGAGRICIAIYAYISGYGMMIKSEGEEDGSIAPACADELINKDYKCVLYQFIKFYMHYWLVFIFFIPIGFIFFDYKFVMAEFIKNFIGISCTYNAEWWYIWQYVRMLLLFPICAYMIRTINIKYRKVIYLSLFFVVILGNYIFDFSSFWIYTCCFIEGMIIAQGEFDIIFFKLDAKKGWLKYGIAIICICATGLARLTFCGKGNYDFILVLFLIYGIIIVLKSKYIRAISKILIFLGKYSIYLWLIHTFFIYYYFQKIVFCFRYSVLIYVFSLMVLVVVANILENIRLFLIKIISNLFNLNENLHI